MSKLAWHEADVLDTPRSRESHSSGSRASSMSLDEVWLRADTPPPPPPPFAYVRTVLYQPVRSLRGPHAEVNVAL